MLAQLVQSNRTAHKNRRERPPPGLTFQRNSKTGLRYPEKRATMGFVKGRSAMADFKEMYLILSVAQQKLLTFSSKHRPKRRKCSSNRTIRRSNLSQANPKTIDRNTAPQPPTQAAVFLQLYCAGGAKTATMLPRNNYCNYVNTPLPELTPQG